ncbi:MAG: hypothetical protein RQ856_02295, partial [Candidatus Izemoplasmatales bacterium]|nr:hypothetical protein [Candidatus Izemoplasmatales bacterium]
LGILMHGKLDFSMWQKQDVSVDFYHLKGLLETLLEQLEITDYSITVSTKELPNLYPGISAVLLVKGKEVGFLGKLHPEEEHKIGIKDVYVCELQLNELLKLSEENKQLYQEIIKYPSIKRDIAILVNNDVTAEKIISSINKTSKKILKSVDIFDVYFDKILSEKKSIALTLEFLSPNRTLETQEVDNQIDKILKNLKLDLNAELRS